MYDYVVYISRNMIEVLNLRTGEVAIGSADFTTQKLLIGNFPSAEKLLTELVWKIASKGIWSRIIRPKLIIQPLDMVEGGLNVMEERAFMELGAIGRKVSVHIGEKLTRETATRLFK